MGDCGGRTDWNVRSGAGDRHHLFESQLARRWAVHEPHDAEQVRDLAIILDRVEFDPTWTDADGIPHETAGGLSERLDI